MARALGTLVVSIRQKAGSDLPGANIGQPAVVSSYQVVYGDLAEQDRVRKNEEPNLALSVEDLCVSEAAAIMKVEDL